MKLSAALCALACALGTASCGLPGSGCRYADTPGTAVILSIGPAPGGTNACPRDPVAVLFRFSPTNSTQAPIDRSISIGDGKHPPRAWVESSGLTVGSAHPAIRSDSVAGACSPLVIKLTDVDYGAANDACF